MSVARALVTVQRHQRIGILGHAGTQNLGDEALLAALIHNVRARMPDTELACFTINPTDTAARHGVPALPIRRLRAMSTVESPAAAPSAWPSARVRRRIKAWPWLHRVLKRVQSGVASLGAVLAEPRFLIDSRRRLQGTDLLLIAGSQQLNDAFGGPWGFPYTLLKWCLLARSVGARVAFLSVGAGPLESRVSRFFCRCAVALATYRSFRDADARSVIEGLGVRGPHAVVPDLACSLPRAPSVPAPKSQSRRLVGLNPVPFADGRYWPRGDAVVYERYIGTLAGFAGWLIQEGHAVVFFPTQLRADPPVIDDIVHALTGTAALGAAGAVQRPRIKSLEDLLAALARADLVVASRYHAIMLGLFLSRPVLGLAYHRKSVELMKHFGQQEYALELDRLDLQTLIRRFQSLEARREVIVQELPARVATLRRALEHQYDEVLRVSGHAPVETVERRRLVVAGIAR